MTGIRELKHTPSKNHATETLSTQEKKSWQGQRRTQVLAILVSVVPMYGALILYHLTAGQQTYSMEGFFGYLTINGSISITIIYLLQRFLIGESFWDLNLKSARWWQDILSVILLILTTLALLPKITQVLTSRLPSQDMSGIGDLLAGISANPLLALLFIGPVLFIGVGFEEVSRAFFLKRAWTAWPESPAKWTNIVISSVVFGIAHLYQGPAGVVSTGIYGLVMAVYYRYAGRVVPMVLAHYLHDAIQFMVIIILIRNGVIQL